MQPKLPIAHTYRVPSSTEVDCPLACAPVVLPTVPATLTSHDGTPGRLDLPGHDIDALVLRASWGSGARGWEC